MTNRTYQFDLKLLTASKDVGLRRLRSYAASLGGGAQIYYAVDDLRRSLETTNAARCQSVVIHDNNLPISAADTAALERLSRVFHLHQPLGPGDTDIPGAASPCWQLESFMRCSLDTLLDSPVIRMSMANLLKVSGNFRLEHLLRWGYASQDWSAAKAATLDDASMAFVRSLTLGGEGRRLTEMASHFLQTRLAHLGLTATGATFGADGLTTTVIAQCQATKALQLADVAEELRIHDFPIAIINCLGTGRLEIAALHHAAQQPGAERIFMLFRKDAALLANDAGSDGDTKKTEDVPTGTRLEKAG